MRPCPMCVRRLESESGSKSYRYHMWMLESSTATRMQQPDSESGGKRATKGHCKEHSQGGVEQQRVGGQPPHLLSCCFWSCSPHPRPHPCPSPCPCRAGVWLHAGIWTLHGLHVLHGIGGVGEHPGGEDGRMLPSAGAWRFKVCWRVCLQSATENEG